MNKLKKVSSNQYQVIVEGKLKGLIFELGNSQILLKDGNELLKAFDVKPYFDMHDLETWIMKRL